MQTRAEQIEEFGKYTQTKAYVEEIAKDKFGLIYQEISLEVSTGVLQTRKMRILQRQPRSRKRTLQEPKFPERN